MFGTYIGGIYNGDWTVYWEFNFKKSFTSSWEIEIIEIIMRTLTTNLIKLVWGKILAKNIKLDKLNKYIIEGSFLKEQIKIMIENIKISETITGITFIDKTLVMAIWNDKNSDNNT